MITEEDLAKLDEITFVLEGRDKPTLVCLSVGSYKKAEELSSAVEQRLPAYRFETLNLRGQQVESLFQAIREQVPAKVLESRPVEYMLHVYGLEDSLFISRGDKPTLSTLIQELNFERENLFRAFPFCILLWTTPYFVDNLKKHAPDLWDWITYTYTFDDKECSETARVESEDWKKLPTGRLAEREERIKELEEKFSSLALGKGGTQRILREKLTVQKLLGREYETASRFSEAIVAYQAVLSLLGQLPKRLVDEEAEVHFLLGNTQLDALQFDQAHNHFEISLKLQQEVGDTSNLGSTFHEIGLAYQAQRHWSEALESYQKAIDSYENIGQHHELGGTFHQIGRVYQEQRCWSEALEFFKKALYWFEKTVQDNELGRTFHQIGRVYEEQRRWSEALKFYLNSFVWIIRYDDVNTKTVASSFNRIRRKVRRSIRERLLEQVVGQLPDDLKSAILRLVLD